MNTNDIVSRLWNLCKVRNDDGEPPGGVSARIAPEDECRW
jgi:hypothetical protein